MVKNAGYALPLFGKFSRLDAMTHWYKATEIYRGKKQLNILILKQIVCIRKNLLLNKIKNTEEKYKHGETSSNICKN